MKLLIALALSAAASAQSSKFDLHGSIARGSKDLGESSRRLTGLTFHVVDTNTPECPTDYVSIDDSEEECKEYVRQSNAGSLVTQYTSPRIMSAPWWNMVSLSTGWPGANPTTNHLALQGCQIDVGHTNWKLNSVIFNNYPNGYNPAEPYGHPNYVAGWGNPKFRRICKYVDPTSNAANATYTEMTTCGENGDETLHKYDDRAGCCEDMNEDDLDEFIGSLDATNPAVAATCASL
jgi:hypothetical protein